MNKNFYRFRSIDRLTNDFKELENQNIYFAHPSQLNDPMEGYRDLYWAGDYIVWKNLFKHYLFCLERLCVLLILSDEQNNLSKENIPVLSGENDLPTPMYKDLFKRISNKFFDSPNILSLIKKISSRTTPIRRDELSFYLTNVHPFAIEIIYSEYEKSNLTSRRSFEEGTTNNITSTFLDEKFIDLLEENLDEHKREEKIIDALFAAQKHAHAQIDILQRHNGNIDTNQSNKNLVIVEFPEEYISQLERLVYPEWYTACFMSECKNSSVWGHYGDNHTGVCLIFNAKQKDNKHYLDFKGINGLGSSGPSYGNISLELHPIDYAQGFGKIDFFRSLGRLTTSTLNSMWYGLEGDRSECADEITQNEGTWRENYWKNFFRDITVKSDDWSYEKEYRLILSSSLDSYSEPASRLLSYDFRSLKGIIFGIKTSKNDKLKIIKIIKEKCLKENRTDFKFYQAYYSADNKCVEHSEMTLLQF